MHSTSPHRINPLTGCTTVPVGMRFRTNIAEINHVFALPDFFVVLICLFFLGGWFKMQYVYTEFAISIRPAIHQH